MHLPPMIKLGPVAFCTTRRISCRQISGGGPGWKFRHIWWRLGWAVPIEKVNAMRRERFARGLPPKPEPWD